jgi:glycosyltransferase involved in cell wall biosynthesis
MQHIFDICIFIDGLTVAGAEKQALVLGRELSRLNVVTFLYLKKPSAFEKERISTILRQEHCKLDFQPLSIQAIWRLLRHKKLTLITFAVKANLIGRILKMCNPKIKLITSIRNERFANVWVNRLYKITAKIYESTVYNSRNSQINGMKQGFSAANKSIIINNYIECEAVIRSEIKPIKRLAYLGRLASQKRVHFLLEALRVLRDNGYDLTLSIHGHGPLREGLMEYADHLGLAEYVYFSGAYKKVADVLADVDLVVLPSEWEGMPNVVLECGVLGIPIIGSDAGGMKDIEESLSQGQFTSIRSKEDLYRLLIKWINKSSQELQEVTVAMRAYVSSEHDPSKITVDWMRVIKNA